MFLRIAFVFVSAQTTIGTPAFCAILNAPLRNGWRRPDLLVPPSGKTAMEALSSFKNWIAFKIAFSASRSLLRSNGRQRISRITCATIGSEKFSVFETNASSAHGIA